MKRDFSEKLCSRPLTVITAEIRRPASLWEILSLASMTLNLAHERCLRFNYITDDDNNITNRYWL